MSRPLLGAGLAALLLLSLAVSAPAHLLGLVLPADQLLLQGFSGTLWRGSASRALLQVPGGHLQLGAVHWSWNPLSLITLAPRISLDSRWGAQTVSGDVTLRGQRDLDLHGVDATIDADLLRQFIPVELAGTVSLQLEQLQLRDGLPQQGKGRLVWMEGAWYAGVARRPLGSYALDFQQRHGESLVGEVLTLSGDVTAEGRVTLAGRAWGIDILVAGPGLSEPQLQQALQLVATPRGGEYHLQMEGEI